MQSPLSFVVVPLRYAQACISRANCACISCQVRPDMPALEVHHPVVWMFVPADGFVANCRFAVAWYPAYRIPDAPLNGRFLTFHYILPQPQHSHMPSSLADASGDLLNLGMLGHSPKQQDTVLPICGLKLCNLHGERWFEPLSLDTVASRPYLHDGQPRAANARSVPQNVQYHLNGLQRNAEYMARGLGLRLTGSRGPERVQQRHPDFEFFHTRH